MCFFLFIFAAKLSPSVDLVESLQSFRVSFPVDQKDSGGEGDGSKEEYTIMKCLYVENDVPGTITCILINMHCLGVPRSLPIISF